MNFFHGATGIAYSLAAPLTGMDGTWVGSFVMRSHKGFVMKVEVFFDRGGAAAQFNEEFAGAGVMDVLAMPCGDANMAVHSVRNTSIRKDARGFSIDLLDEKFGTHAYRIFFKEE